MRQDSHHHSSDDAEGVHQGKLMRVRLAEGEGEVVHLNDLELTAVEVDHCAEVDVIGVEGARLSGLHHL